MYELLDEMLDNGFPLATESNILKELIKPPNILRTVVNSVTGKTKYVFLIYLILKILESFLFCMYIPWVFYLACDTSPQSSMSTAKWQNISGSEIFFTF